MDELFCVAIKPVTVPGMVSKASPSEIYERRVQVLWGSYTKQFIQYNVFE